MGLKDRNKMKVNQRVKRRKKRLKLLKKGLNPDDYYLGSLYVGHDLKSAE